MNCQDDMQSLIELNNHRHMCVYTSVCSIALFAISCQNCLFRNDLHWITFISTCQSRDCKIADDSLKTFIREIITCSLPVSSEHFLLLYYSPLMIHTYVCMLLIYVPPA